MGILKKWDPGLLGPLGYKRPLGPSGCPGTLGLPLGHPRPLGEVSSL